MNNEMILKNLCERILIWVEPRFKKKRMKKYLTVLIKPIAGLPEMEEWDIPFNKRIMVPKYIYESIKRSDLYQVNILKEKE